MNPERPTEYVKRYSTHCTSRDYTNIYPLTFLLDKWAIE